MKKIAQQVIIIRKDIIELSKSEFELLSDIKKEEYMKIKEEVGLMNRGKLGTQTAHASSAILLRLMRNNVTYKDYEAPKEDYTLSMKVSKDSALSSWIEGSFRKIVVYVKNERELLKYQEKLNKENIINELICDSGFTIFNNPTNTCIGVEPMFKEDIDKVTKKLQLLK